MSKAGLNLSEFEEDQEHVVDETGEGELLQETIERPRPPQSAKELEGVAEIPVEVSAVLGHTSMPVSKLLNMGVGMRVPLDRKVGEAIDIHVNNRLVARGEVVVVDDKLGISMTEIIKTEAN